MTVTWRSPLDLEPGSAESLKSERRPFRLSRRLWLFGAAVIALTVFSIMSLASADLPPPARSQHRAHSMPSPSAASPLERNLYEGEGHAIGVSVHTQEPAGQVETAAADGSRRAYALPLARISGLPSIAQPGTMLDLWALWEPPVTEKVNAQLLIREVVLEGIVPAVTPHGPETAILLVPKNRISDLIYADRFSQMSAALIR